MAKFWGKITFAKQVENKPGVCKDEITTREYYGDLTRNVLKNQDTNQVNSNLNISNEISIVADSFANENFYSMRYVEFMGAKWKISNIEVKYPRLILTIGGVYNGK